MNAKELRAKDEAALKQELDDSYQDVDRTLFTDDELKQIDETYAESAKLSRL